MILSVVLAALIITPVQSIAIEESSDTPITTSFVSEYLLWKTQFGMSAFTPKEDYAINMRATTSDCASHAYYMRFIATTYHMPKDALKNKETLARFDASMRRFVQLCQKRNQTK